LIDYGEPLRFHQERIMPFIKVQPLSVWEVAYAIDMAIASAITYYLMAFVVPLLTHRPEEPVGILWAVISTVFVFRDTRAHSLAAGISRLAATCVSFVLCFVYLLLLPPGPLALIVLIAISALLMMVLGRRDDIGLAAITTVVVLIVAVSSPQNAWQQPLLRLTDTVVGVTVGIACKWIASFLFYRLIGEEVR
jgi:uncharacterized membrane protein YgaE (UPF0421/DUF939 family)